MTDEEAAAIRERAEAATQGPWVNDTSEILGVGHLREPVIDYVYRNVDAEFIAHAREDIPALLDERAALVAFVEDVGAIMGGSLDDALLAIKHAREINRTERPFSERLNLELIDAEQHLRSLRTQARALLGAGEGEKQP